MAAHLQSAVIPSAALPVIPSIVPKITALTATKVENQANGIGLNFNKLLNKNDEDDINISALFVAILCMMFYTLIYL